MAFSNLTEKDMERVSDIICTQMKLNGKTITEARILHTYTSLDEFLLSTYGGLRTYYTGSFGEASFLPDSDQDIMIVAPDICVYTNSVGCINDDNETVFTAVVDPVLPCYGNLKAYKLIDNDPDFKNILETGCDGQIYLSSERYVDYFLGKARQKMKDRYDLHWFRNGPCASFIPLTVGHLEYERKISDVDVAYAIRCTDWPKEVIMRFSNKEPNEWPTADMRERIKSIPCHYVASGKQNSPTSSIDWRLSFVFAERELLRSFNEKQYICFVLMKMLKKSILLDIDLTTYHIKTILFWHLEENADDWWQNNNIIECIRSLLRRLKTTVEQKSLPHYFVPQNNLFYNKFEDLKSRSTLARNLELLIEDTSPILQHPSMGALSELWTQYNTSIFLEVAESSWTSASINENVKSEQKLIVALHALMIFTRIMRLSVNDSIMENFVHEMKSLPSETEFKDCLQKFLDILQGLREQSIALASNSLDLKRIHQELAQKAFERGLGADSLSSHLYLATFWFVSGELQQSKDRLIIALSRKLGILYYGSCSKHGFLKTEPMLSVSIMKTEPIGHVPPHRRGSTGDVIFTAQYISCYPKAIQIECGCSEVAVSIHPLIYAYYLFVLVYHEMGDIKQRQEALSDLENSLPLTKGGENRYVALNLLGSCYQLTGEHCKAYQTFVRSARESPEPTNAAYIHILDMYFSCVKYQKTA